MSILVSKTLGKLSDISQDIVTHSIATLDSKYGLSHTCDYIKVKPISSNIFTKSLSIKRNINKVTTQDLISSLTSASHKIFISRFVSSVGCLVDNGERRDVEDFKEFFYLASKHFDSVICSVEFYTQLIQFSGNFFVKVEEDAGVIGDTKYAEVELLKNMSSSTYLDYNGVSHSVSLKDIDFIAYNSSLFNMTDVLLTSTIKQSVAQDETKMTLTLSTDFMTDTGNIVYGKIG